MEPQNSQPVQPPQMPEQQEPVQPVEPAPPANTQQMPATPMTDKPKKRITKLVKIIGIIVAAFVIFIVVAGVIAGLATKAPQKISDQFVNDIQSGDSKSAYLLTSESFQQATSVDQLDQVIKQVGPLLQGDEKVTGRAIQKSSGSPQTAVLVYEVKTTSSTKYMKIELQKNGDAWQVINFRSSESPLDTTVE